MLFQGVKLLISASVLAAIAVCEEPPKFRDKYEVGGMLYLPYAEIKEPFMAYYDAVNNLSRIDYYNGLMETFQLAGVGVNGVAKKVVYMSNNTNLNVRSCFQTNGTENSTVKIQSVFPDLSTFKYAGKEICPSYEYSTKTCMVWKKVEVMNTKKNTYTMWVKSADNGVLPVRYEMIGVDTLFGSHYDRYYMTYQSYSPGAVDPKKFNVDSNLTCGGFPGPGLEATHLHNPMHEFINNDNSHIHKAFDAFKSVYGKEYKHLEHEKRKNTFTQNFRYIHSMNRKANTYTLGVNHLADLSNGEMKMMRGRISSKGYNGGLPFSEPKDMFMPDMLDWRYYGAVTPVKDQAVCGSCWSFGTVGTIEGANFLKTRNLVRLSQQQLIDCSWGQGNNGCDGGEDFRSYKYIMENGGLESEETYGRYLGSDGKCHHNESLSKVHLKGFVNVTSGDLSALQMALYHHGPISVSIDAALKSFSFYANGVFYNADCGNKDADLDHSVLAVGYGILDGQPYWLIKNSWSTNWGNDGYVFISQKDNNCGVATEPTYVLLKD